MPHGHWVCAYRIIGDVKPRRGQSLIDLLHNAKQRHTGWPAWWVPSRGPIAPYPMNGNIECWMARDGQVLHNNPAHADFWRAATNGKMFLLRGYDEDGYEGIQPGKVLDVSLPIWRVGECLLHAAAMSQQITDNDSQAKIDFHITWTGIQGRKLSSVTGNRIMRDSRESLQAVVHSRGTFVASTIPDLLPEVTTEITQPLYEVFDFFKPSQALIVGELTNMRRNQF